MSPEGDSLEAVDQFTSRSANMESAIDGSSSRTPHFDATINLESSTIWESDELVVRDAVNPVEPLPVFDIDSDFTMFEAYPPLIAFLNTGQISPITASDETKSIQAVPCHFISNIEKACRKYIAQTLGLPETVTIAKTPSTHLDIEKRGVQCISDVAAIAVYLLTVFSGLDTYIYGIGSDVPFERIMRWRISPTLQNRLAIPDPFRPTPLQYNLLDHPVAIDFVPSSSLRDQLILKASDCDLDRIIQDILLHTVVEVPKHRVALATLDVYMQNILPSDKTHELENRAILAPSWSLFQYNATQIEDILVHEVSWRMKNGPRAGLMSGESDPIIPRFRKNPLACKYGLDRVGQWKLSKEFRDSHPDLDCTVCEFRPFTISALRAHNKSYLIIPCGFMEFNSSVLRRSKNG
ncbi:uncharacterized protein BDZ99DRAFT_48785 [Mytilinidion resinicola]|uniref:Uncharacterized protein n=1 Tax=Mytilinidion resinicola TaxID=574789 RepID=A0A6A6YJN9_9PEZI|nr:uncharacterized protein BDZ99DRAFT_48785 [Mytilinidion resinicola]KAF2808175.1 hypothetical protein BDZ99DRAFT_48785 [Mytilinidion resinicola]